MNRSKLLIIVSSVIALIIITFAGTYAFFTANLTGESTSTISVGGGTMSITVSGGPAINISNIIPGDNIIVTKTITITGTNTTDLDMPYTLELLVETNTFSDSMITYMLDSTNTSSNGSIIPSITTQQGIVNGSSTITFGTGKLTTGVDVSHTYVLNLYFPDNGDQNSEQGRQLEAYVTLDADKAINPLNEYIISLAGDSVNTGVYNENGYRYEGLNPNNYLSFNGETWRIIGIVDDMIKIIRNSPIGVYTWDASDINNFSTSDIKVTLDNYYNNMQPASKSLVAQRDWNLGGSSTEIINSSEFYSFERGITVFDSHPPTISSFIGLMYPSDYGYAVVSSSCNRTITLNNYNNAGCANQNWLFWEDNEWLQTPHSANGSNVYSLSINGSINNASANNSYYVRPVVYIKPSTSLIGGTGNGYEPYIIN